MERIFSVTWTWYWTALIREFACVPDVYSTDSSSSLSPWRAFQESSPSLNLTRNYLLTTLTGTWPQDALSRFHFSFYLSHLVFLFGSLSMNWSQILSSTPSKKLFLLTFWGYAPCVHSSDSGSVSCFYSTHPIICKYQSFV